VINRRARFPPGPALFAPQAIEGGRTNGSVEEGAIVDRVLSPPKADKCLLDNVFSIGPAIGPAAGEEEQRRSQLCKTGLPSFIGSASLHDLFTVFYL
jgi:hypothetical protein